jgi:hypothetical protein
MKTTLIALMVLLYGCCTQPEIQRETVIETRIDTVRVIIPADNDYSLITLDSTGFGENEKYEVRIDTVWKSKIVYVKGKADTLKVPVIDTLWKEKIVYTKDNEGFFDGVTLKDIMLFIGVIVTLGFIAQFTNRR